eukprot:1161244-Pelagomonas_calceolata.AAC.8
MSCTPDMWRLHRASYELPNQVHSTSTGQVMSCTLLRGACTGKSWFAQSSAERLYRASHELHINAWHLHRAKYE